MSKRSQTSLPPPLPSLFSYFNLTTRSGTMTEASHVLNLPESNYESSGRIASHYPVLLTRFNVLLRLPLFPSYTLSFRFSSPKHTPSHHIPFSSIPFHQVSRLPAAKHPSPSYNSTTTL